MKTVISLLLICFAIQVYAQTPECEAVVYPGDFNKDGIVSVHDALYWGVMYGTTGPQRPNATNDWTPQVAPDWSGSINQINNKNQDGNGNGLIDTLDLQALYQNYDSTHTCIVKNESTAADVFMVYYAEDEIGTMLRREYHVHLKSLAYHGCAFTMDYGELDAVIEIGVDTTDSGLEPAALVVVEDAANEKVHIAVTRTDQMDDIDASQLLIIVICEDIAGLTGEENKVFFTDIQSIKSDYEVTAYDDVIYESPPFPAPDICEQIFDLEYCPYQNGIINSVEAYNNTSGLGTCFEGRLYGSDAAALPLSCDDERKYFTSGTNDTLWFQIKTDAAGVGEVIEVYLEDIQGESSNKISTEILSTNYQQTGIPINDLLQNIPLDSIEKIYFSKTNGTGDFHIYVDEIYVNQLWNIWWRGDRFSYEAATPNDTETCTGTYSFQLMSSGMGFETHSVGNYDFPTNLSFYDEICFNAKADEPDKMLTFSFTPFQFPEWYKPVNINDYIPNGNLTNTYQKICIPLDSLKADCEHIRCELGYVDQLTFYTNDIEPFNFYLDDIRVIRGNAEDCTECFRTSTTSHLSDKIPLSVFPNPTSDHVNIEIFHPNNIHIQIIDLQGQIIHSTHIHSSDTTKNLSYSTTHLQTGMYIVHVTDHNGQSSNSKFIKM